MTDTDTDTDSDSDTERRPWICPTCGHFLVRPDAITCRRCSPAVPLVAYTGSEQADTIRRTQMQATRQGLCKTV